MQYLEEELQKGKRFFLLHMPGPVGIVSVHGPMLEHLYVLPQAQGHGFGTQLLRFALAQGAYMLWVLDLSLIHIYLKINGVWEDHLHMVKLNEAMHAGKTREK